MQTLDWCSKSSSFPHEKIVAVTVKPGLAYSDSIPTRGCVVLEELYKITKPGCRGGVLFMAVRLGGGNLSSTTYNREQKKK